MMGNLDMGATPEKEKLFVLEVEPIESASLFNGGEQKGRIKYDSYGLKSTNYKIAISYSYFKNCLVQLGYNLISGNL